MRTPRRWLATWMVLLGAWQLSVNASEALASATHEPRLWRLATQEQKLLEDRGTILKDRSLAEYLQTVVERLWQQVSSDMPRPTITVITDSGMAAHAYPNGHIVLTSGMLTQLENEDQLAMIIAHEMVHYYRQHTARIYDHFRDLAPQADRSDAGGRRMATQRTVAVKIDAAERQADEEGLSIVDAAGYCQTRVLDLMTNLMHHLPDNGNSQPLHHLKNRSEMMRRHIGDEPMRSCPARPISEAFFSHLAPVFTANARIALQNGDWNQADSSVTRLLAFKPNDARAYYLKGEILRRRNGGSGRQSCIGAYEKALKIDPDFPLAHRALGEVYYKAGRYGMARPYFEAFLSLAPEDASGNYVKGYLQRCRQ